MIESESPTSLAGRRNWRVQNLMQKSLDDVRRRVGMFVAAIIAFCWTIGPATAWLSGQVPLSHSRAILFSLQSPVLGIAVAAFAGFLAIQHARAEVTPFLLAFGLTTAATLGVPAWFAVPIPESLSVMVLVVLAGFLDRRIVRFAGLYAAVVLWFSGTIGQSTVVLPEDVYGLSVVVHSAALVSSVVVLELGIQYVLRQLGISAERKAEIELTSWRIEQTVEARTTEFALREACSQVIVETAPDAIATFDADGTIRSINHAGGRLFGFDHGKMGCLKIWELFSSPFDDILKEQLGEMCREGKRESLGISHEMSGKKSNGESFPASLAISEVPFHGRVIYAAFVRDVSLAKFSEQMMSRYIDEIAEANVSNALQADELRRLMAEVEAARARAEQASRTKSDFLASMSHEIRTPMNGILGLTGLALATSLTDEQRDYLTTVRGSAESLLEILNELLDFSKVEAGRLELHSSRFTLRKMLASMMSTFAMKTREKKLELHCRVDPEIPEELFADDLRLRQVLTNLLGNAVKFTSAGSVSLECSIKASSVEQVELLFAVRDTGIGIPFDKQQRVFEAFAQADSSTARHFGGTGLGLAISSRLVRLMGGTLEVQSDEGRGSIFSFCVQMDRAPESTEASTAALRFEGVRADIHVQNEGHRKVVLESLQSFGVAVTERRPEDPLWQRSLPVAVPNSRTVTILDAEGILASGEFSHSILLEETSGGKGLIVLCWHDERSEITRLFPNSVIVSKPVFRQELFAAVDVAIHGRSLDHSHKSLEVGRVSSGLMGRGRRVLLADDNPVNQKVAGKILESVGFSIETAADGHEVLRLMSQSTYALVLMDVQMPGKDGLEATAEIRRRESSLGKHTPVVAMTACAMKGDQERCLEAGMDGYVSKPIRIQELFAELERVLPTTCDQGEPVREEAAKTESQESSIPVESSNGRPWVVPEAIWAKTLHDQEFLGELLQLFEENGRLLLEECRNAWAENDAERLYQAAHAYKGMVGNFTVDAPYRSAKSLEELGRSGALQWVGKVLSASQKQFEEIKAELRAILKAEGAKDARTKQEANRTAMAAR